MMRRIEPVFVTGVIPLFGHLLPGPAGGRDRENLFEEQPFWVLRIYYQWGFHFFRQQ